MSTDLVNIIGSLVTSIVLAAIVVGILWLLFHHPRLGFFARPRSDNPEDPDNKNLSQ